MKSTASSPSPRYTGNTRRRVRCLSGVMGERSRLRSRYASREDFDMWNETHEISRRLGLESGFSAWNDNPVIESSVNPGDLRVVFP